MIIGSDDFLVESAAKKIIGDRSGLEVIDSNISTNAELQLRDIQAADASFSTPPFLDPRKVTWWRNVNFLPGGKKETSEEVKAALAKFAEKLGSVELPEEQHFIISGPHLLKTSIFAKRVSKLAEVCVFPESNAKGDIRSTVVRAIDIAKDMGLSFSSGAAEGFIALVGTDTRLIISELGKLRDYLGNERNVITSDDIAEISCPGIGIEVMLWDVTDAIGRRDLAGALNAIHKFEAQNGFEVFMTMTIEKFFRQMIDVAMKRTNGINPYVISKLGAFARNWSLGELKIARQRFFNLREKVVSGFSGGKEIIITDLIRIMRRRAR